MDTGKSTATKVEVKVEVETGNLSLDLSLSFSAGRGLRLRGEETVQADAPDLVEVRTICRKQLLALRGLVALPAAGEFTPLGAAPNLAPRVPATAR
jgi:hypothetical protein